MHSSRVVIDQSCAARPPPLDSKSVKATSVKASALASVEHTHDAPIDRSADVRACVDRRTMQCPHCPITHTQRIQSIDRSITRTSIEMMDRAMERAISRSLNG